MIHIENFLDQLQHIFENPIVLLGIFVTAILIKLTLCNRRTLIARPSADLATERATAKISFALFPRDLLDASDGSHLPMDLAPIKCERCMWVCIHLVRFARIVIGVEDEATIVDLFEKHDPS